MLPIRTSLSRCIFRSLSTCTYLRGTPKIFDKMREDLNRAAFRHFDKDNSGLISPAEFTEVVDKELKLGLSKTEIREMIQKIDTDSSGQIDYVEFLEGKHILEEKKVLAKLNGMYLGPESFRIFDYDGSGSVDTEEFLTVLRNMGLKLTESEAEELVKLVDADGSGDVDYEEFMDMMNQGGINK